MSGGGYYTDGSLRSGRYAEVGIGDPCTYYLGDIRRENNSLSVWRTPTSAEWLALLGPGGAYAKKENSYLEVAGLRFYPSGSRNELDGAHSGASIGSYWSSSTSNDVDGYGVSFEQGSVNPQASLSRSSGAPVRCVTGTYVPPPPVVDPPPSADDYVEVGGLRWAKGNLVAKNDNECMVGASTDYGLYFHFGSLVGWSGGANGDGTGAGSPTAVAVKVQPKGYTGSVAWPAGYYTGGTAGSTGCGLPTADDASAGVGDPCRYYLGADWRTPTAADFIALFSRYTHWYDIPGWSWQETPPGAKSTSSLFFPISGMLSFSNGSWGSATSGVYWSSSVYDWLYGYDLNLHKSGVQISMLGWRASGYPVRCVSNY